MSYANSAHQTSVDNQPTSALPSPSPAKGESKIVIPYGGIFLGLTSAIFFFFSVRNKNRSKKMDNSPHYDHQTIQNANDGEYCSLSGYVQPMVPGKYIKTEKGINTVLFTSSIVERVKITTQYEETEGQRTRNPRKVLRRRTDTKEIVVSEPYESRVNFGLFDITTKKNIELNIRSSIFDGSLIENRTLMPNNSQGGININIDNSNSNVIGEISRVVESIWKVENHLPVDVLDDNDRPRYLSTVFGVVQKNNNQVSITDQGTTFDAPCIYALRTRNSIIDEQKTNSKILHYVGIGFALFAGLSTYFEFNGLPKEKVNRNW